MSATAPTLVHFGTMVANLGESFVIRGGPAGTRIVAEVDAVELTGDRVTASMVGTSAADWLTVGPDGTYGILDVRFTLKTTDDAIIYVEYGGRIDLAKGKATAAPTFQTGAEHYDWMNRIQALGVGKNDDGVLTYELYEVST